MKLPYFCSTRKPSNSRRTHHPFLEVLEDRTLPATVTWVAGSGDWDVGTNWDTGTVPASGDVVLINTAGITVTHSQGIDDAIYNLTSQADIDFSAGSLAITRASSISGVLTLSGGTLTLIAGDLQAAGGFTFSGGTVAGSSTLYAGGTVDFSGSITVGPNTTLDLTGAANTGTFAVDSLTLHGNLAAGTESFVVGSFVWQNDSSQPITLGGTGTLELTGSGQIDTGPAILTDMTVAIDGAATLTYHSSPQLTVNGAVQFNNYGTFKLDETDPAGANTINSPDRTARFHNYPGATFLVADLGGSFFVPMTNDGLLDANGTGLDLMMTGTNHGQVGGGGFAIRSSGDSLMFAADSSIAANSVTFNANGTPAITVAGSFQTSHSTVVLGSVTFTGAVNGFGSSLEVRFGSFADLSAVPNPTTFTLDTLTVAGVLRGGAENFVVNTLDMVNPSGDQQAVDGTGTITVNDSWTALITGAYFTGYTLNLGSPSNSAVTSDLSFAGSGGLNLGLANDPRTTTINNYGNLTVHGRPGESNTALSNDAHQPSAYFNNFGSFTLEGAGCDVNVFVVFNNSGLVEAQSGTSLTIGFGGTDSGSFLGEDGSFLRIHSYFNSTDLTSSSSLVGDQVELNSYQAGNAIEGVYRAKQTRIVSDGGTAFVGDQQLDLGTSLDAYTVNVDFSGRTTPPTFNLQSFLLRGGHLIGPATFNVGDFTWDAPLPDYDSTISNATINVSGTTSITGERAHNQDNSELNSTPIDSNVLLTGNGIIGANFSNGGVVSPGHSPGRIVIKGTAYASILERNR